MGTKKVLSASYLSSVCMELSLVLKAGIQLGDGVAMLAEDEPDKYVKSVLTSVKNGIERGDNAYKSFASTRAFPKYMTDMIEIGEKTGRLEKVFKSLSGYYDRQEQIAVSIKNAVEYPAVLLFMMLFVIVILITKVLPIFNDVYIQLGGKMSGTASAIMRLGSGLKSSWVLIVGILAGLVVALFIATRIPAVSSAVKAFFGNHLYGRGLGRAIGKARLASALAMTMSAGLETGESLKMAEKIVTNRALLQKIAKCRDEIKKGITPGTAIADAGIFSALHTQMLAIGFRTGSSDTVMDEIARRCEEDVAERTERALSRIEPTLVIIMSLVVGIILISVMLPLMTIMSAL
jgi:type IV pilus assembly protein PilC